MKHLLVVQVTQVQSQHSELFRCFFHLSGAGIRNNDPCHIEMVL